MLTLCRLTRKILPKHFLIKRTKNISSVKTHPVKFNTLKSSYEFKLHINGVEKFSKLLKPKHCSFHTSGQLQALPPFLWMILKPITKFSVMILSRAFRKWRQALPKDRKLLFSWRKVLIVFLFIASLYLAVKMFYAYSQHHNRESLFTNREKFDLFTAEQFEEISQLQYEIIMDDYRDRLLENSHPTYKRVSRVAQQFLNGNNDINRIHNKQWAIHIIEDDSENAFVLPTGKIFVFTGMLEQCKNDDQLGIVLGHEMAHVILGHGAELQSREYILDLLKILATAFIWAVLPSDIVSGITHWIAHKMTELILELPYKRNLENEADEVGLILAAKACFDVRESSAFWSRMEALKHSRGDRDIEWLSTHPAHENRSENLDKLIPKAIETRTTCKCADLPHRDPRNETELFKKAVTKTLKSKNISPVVPNTDSKS